MFKFFVSSTFYGIFKMFTLSEQEKQIAQLFPSLNVKEIHECDRLVKAKIKENINPEMLDCITDLFVKEIGPKIKTHNHTKVNQKNLKKKCKKLASIYINNDAQYLLQENWFCLLAYFLSIVSMLCRIAELNTQTNDHVSLLSYLVTLIIWLLITTKKSLMGKKAICFFNCFNRVAPSMTILGGIVFYLLLFVHCKLLLFGSVILSVTFTLWLTVLKYNDDKKWQNLVLTNDDIL